MKRVIKILKENGFERMDVNVYANKKGVCFILTKSEINVINSCGDTIESFRNVRYDSETNFLVVGFLYAKGLLYYDYELPESYQIN